MKKNLLILLGIFFLVIAILSYIYYNMKKINILSSQVNKEYESYAEGNILGTSLMTLMHKAINQNERNEIPKDNRNYYSENEENSIKIEIKFLESDKIYPMEAIVNLGSEQFIKNYNSMQFKCTKKEYHRATNYIKYMLFEQII